MKIFHSFVEHFVFANKLEGRVYKGKTKDNVKRVFPNSHLPTFGHLSKLDKEHKKIHTDLKYNFSKIIYRLLFLKINT